MKKMKRWGLVLLSMIVLLILGLYAYWNSFTPKYEGEQSLSGLKAEVNVQFDDFGIPHIKASNGPDAYRTLGYIAASERAFQMDLMRRVANGRLCEIFGAGALEADLLFSTVGIREAAQSSEEQFLKNAPEDVQAEVVAYLDGVNAFLSEGTPAFEFTLLGYEPDTFRIADMYSIAGYMAWGLGMAQKTDPLVSNLRDQYGEDWINQLFLHPTETDHHIPSFPMDQASDSLLGFMDVIDLFPVGAFEGSNAWALNSDRTTTGNALMCNDTHIGYGIPQVWYEAHLSFPGMEFYGNYLPGIPYALVGHNDFCTWGLTMFENDDMEFYAEYFPDADHYEHDSIPYPARKRDRVIKIKDAQDTTIQIVETHHGPLVQDVFPLLNNRKNVSMRWDYLKGDNQLFSAFRSMNRAQSMLEFETAVSKIHGPGLNIVYADKEDNIAWWACARLLEWNEGVETKALLDGRYSENEPVNALPFNLNPQQINPPSGVVYSANSQPMMTNGELYPGYYVPETRAERLKTLFGDRKKWDTDGMKELLYDCHNESDRRSAKQFEVLLRKSDIDYSTLEQLGMKYLANLGDYQREEISVSIYTHLLYSLVDTAFSEKMSAEEYQALIKSHWFKRALPELIMDSEHPAWDLKSSGEIETLEDLLPGVYRQCLNELVLKHSKNLDKWTWGDLHTLEFEHPMAQGGALFKSLYNIGPFPSPGSNETLMQSGFVGNTDMAYQTHFGAQMRIVMDCSDMTKGESITPTGQSGHRWSAHYKDQVEMYMNAQWRPMHMNFDFESKLYGEMLFLP